MYPNATAWLRPTEDRIGMPIGPTRIPGPTRKVRGGGKANDELPHLVSTMVDPCDGVSILVSLRALRKVEVAKKHQ